MTRSIYYDNFMTDIDRLNMSLESFKENLEDPNYLQREFLLNSFVVLLCSIGENYFRNIFQDYIDNKNTILKDAQIKQSLVNFTIKKDYPKDTMDITENFQVYIPVDQISLNYSKIEKYYKLIGVNIQIEESLKSNIGALVDKRNNYAHKQANVDCTMSDIKRYVISLVSFVTICDGYFPR
jgi:RiboL-PSP-HEPN